MTDDVTWPRKVKLVTPIRLERNISKTILELETSNLVRSFIWGMPSGRTNNVPWKWAWPRSRDPTIFGIRSNISPKLLELEISNLVRGFVWEWRASAQIIFPESERGLDLCLDSVSGQLTGLRPEHPLLLSDFRIIKPSECRHIGTQYAAVRPYGRLS